MRRHLRRTIRGADPLVRAGPPGPAYPQRNQLHSVASPIPGASRAPFTPNCTLAKLPNCTFPMSARTRYTHPVTRERHAIIQDFTGGNHPHRPGPRSAPTSRQYRDQRLLPRSAERVRTASRPRLPPHHRAAGGVRREPALPGRRGVEPLARSTRRGHSDFGFDELQHFRRHVTRLPPGARTPRQPPPPHAAVPARRRPRTPPSHLVGAYPIPVLRDRRPTALPQLADQARHHTGLADVPRVPRPPPPASVLPLQLRQPALDLHQFLAHLRHVRHVGQLLQVLLQRTCRRPPDRLPAAHNLRRQHAAPRTQHRPRFDPRLVPNPHLPADHRVILHHHAPREPRLCRHHHVLPDVAVVPHVYHVVQFGPLADRCPPQRGAVHARVRPDLHEVRDLHPAHLRKLVPPFVFHHVAEPVRPDHASRVQHAPPTDIHVVVYRHVGMQHAAFAQRHPLAHHADRVDRRRHADPRRLAHHRVRSDVHHGPHLDILADHRRGVYAELEFHRRIEAVHGARERRPRLPRPDHHPVRRGRPLHRHDQAPCRRRFGRRRRLARSHEGHIARTGRFQRRYRAQFLLAVAFVGGAQPLRQFPYSHAINDSSASVTARFVAAAQSSLPRPTVA